MADSHVIALKFRPKTFGQVVGQEAIIRTLRNAIETGRIYHAYLFAGARGVGKTTTARIVAKSLNCANGPSVNPCGVCDSCVEIAAPTSVTFWRSTPPPTPASKTFARRSSAALPARRGGTDT